MNKIISNSLLFVFVLSTSACSTNQKSEQPAPAPVAAVESRTKAVEVKKAQAMTQAEPLKGKFLDYIQEITKSQTLSKFKVNSSKLSNGYAFLEFTESEGAMLEYFMFRGAKDDLVFEVIRGWEDAVQKDQTYGFQVTPYRFKDGKMTREKVGDVFAIKKIDKLFLEQHQAMVKDARFAYSWKYTRLMKFPVKGTSIELNLCKDTVDPVFLTDSSCVTVGTLNWNKVSFDLKKVKVLTIKEEQI